MSRTFERILLLCLGSVVGTMGAIAADSMQVDQRAKQIAELERDVRAARREAEEVEASARQRAAEMADLRVQVEATCAKAAESRIQYERALANIELLERLLKKDPAPVAPMPLPWEEPAAGPAKDSRS